MDRDKEVLERAATWLCCKGPLKGIIGDNMNGNDLEALAGAGAVIASLSLPFVVPLAPVVYEAVSKYFN